MHLTRSEIGRVTPIPRKGTRYIARPLAYTTTSVTVLAAVRDMLQIARTAHEVEEMIKEKKLKINGRVVRDVREPLTLLSLFEADKLYVVSLLPTGRFTLKPTKTHHRIAKIINKKLMKKGIVQVNLHDGTNILTKEKMGVGDSLEMDEKLTILRVIPLKVGAHVLVSSGRNVGSVGTVTHLEGETVTLTIDGRNVSLKRTQVVAQ